MTCDQLDLCFDLFDHVHDFIFSLTDLLLEGIIKERRKLAAEHRLMGPFTSHFVLTICETVHAFELLTIEAVVGERLVVMKGFAAASWAVVG